MNSGRLIFTLLLFPLLFAVVFVLANPGDVRGQMTIPTRTPVPDDNGDGDNGDGDNGDDGNGDGDNGGGGEQASPTNTPTAQNTVAPPAASATYSSATATTQPPATRSTATAVSSPTSGSQTDIMAPGSTPITFPAEATSFPTAGPCGEPPTFTTLTTAKVYLGPGSDYPASDTLGAKEVRPIVGRAANAAWWLIQLDGKFAQGWIRDKVGTVQGYTDNVPIIIAPTIDGAFPTPGPQWDPTSAPICTPTPTPTGDSAVVSGIIADGDDVANGDKVQVSSESVQTTENGNVSSEQRSQIAEAARPLEIPSATKPTPNLLPIAGLILVIAAVFVALFLRRSPSRSDPSS